MFGHLLIKLKCSTEMQHQLNEHFDMLSSYYLERQGTAVDKIIKLDRTIPSELEVGGWIYHHDRFKRCLVNGITRDSVSLITSFPYAFKVFKPNLILTLGSTDHPCMGEVILHKDIVPGNRTVGILTALAEQVHPLDLLPPKKESIKDSIVLDYSKNKQRYGTKSK